MLLQAGCWGLCWGGGRTDIHKHVVAAVEGAEGHGRQQLLLHGQGQLLQHLWAGGRQHRSLPAAMSTPSPHQTSTHKTHTALGPATATYPPSQPATPIRPRQTHLIDGGGCGDNAHAA